MSRGNVAVCNDDDEGRLWSLDKQGPYRKTEGPRERNNYIYEWRMKRGLTQGTLAQLVGCAAPTISQIENGSRETTVKLLRAIAYVLEVEPGWLLSLDPTNDADPWYVFEILKDLPPDKRERAKQVLELLLDHEPTQPEP